MKKQYACSLQKPSKNGIERETSKKQKKGGGWTRGNVHGSNSGLWHDKRRFFSYSPWKSAQRTRLLSIGGSEPNIYRDLCLRFCTAMSFFSTTFCGDFDEAVVADCLYAYCRGLALSDPAFNMDNRAIIDSPGVPTCYCSAFV